MYSTQQNGANQIPGYTGYQPAHLREEDEKLAMAAMPREDDPQGTKVPGYKGYVPGIKSENVFGATYGCTTRGTKMGAYPRGFDVNDKERYGSVTQQTYTPQMSQKVIGAQYDRAQACATPGMSYQEINAQASVARQMDPNPMPKVPMLTQQTLSKILNELRRRGANGIRGLAIVFRRMDNNGDKRLDREDLRIGLRENGHELSDMEFDRVFQYFDRDGNGKVNFDEFMRGVRGDLNQRRKALVHQAFAKLDKTGDGCVDLRDLAQIYDPSMHPKFKTGEMNKDQILTEFLG